MGLWPIVMIMAYSPGAHPPFHCDVLSARMTTALSHVCCCNGTLQSFASLRQMSQHDPTDGSLVSKNAEEMLGALTLQYNRKRQAKITTELIEIISGAAAAEDMTK